MHMYAIDTWGKHHTDVSTAAPGVRDIEVAEVRHDGRLVNIAVISEGVGAVALMHMTPDQARAMGVALIEAAAKVDA